MRALKSLSSGLLAGAIIAVTVFSALVLSVRGQPVSIGELPMPTVTLQMIVVSPTASPTLAGVVTQTAISATPSASFTPTATRCPIPADWQRYVVGPFDTLLSIAQRFALTPDQLVLTNCLAKPSVSVGQTIYVPGFKPTPTAVPCYPPYNWARYVVQPGDTLSSIAARYNISVYTLMRANCLATSYIYYGQLLYVPAINPIVTFPPTPVIPTVTPTPPIGTFTPTLPATDTPTAMPTTPVITETPGPSATPGSTETPVPTDTPSPTNLPAPTDTPAPTATAAPIEPPSNTPAPAPTGTSTP